MHHPLSSRQMLHLSAGTLLSLGLWPGALRAEGKGNSGNFHFVVINDIHYINEKCATFLDRVLKQIKSGPAPEFALIAGDLSHHGTQQEFGAVKDLFAQLRIPVFVLPGNHDYVTQSDRKQYEQIFPKQLNYTLEHKGWQFIGFDSTDGLRAANTKIQREPMEFLKETASRISKIQPTVLFTHFPLGEKVDKRPLNAEAVLELFKEHNLQATFGGHHHGFTERSLRAATLVTNRCCSFSQPNHDGTKEKGFFACSAQDGYITRSFVEVSTANI
jgi:Icc-related predicted phosphoesterase